MKYRQTMLFSNQLNGQEIASPALITDVIPGFGKKCVFAFGTTGTDPKTWFQFVVHPESPLINTSIQIAKEQRLRLVSGAAMITWVSPYRGSFGVAIEDRDPAPENA